MNPKKARYISENFEAITNRDRIFLNNPVILQGLGLAPLVVVATTGQNALMIFLAVAMLLLPVRLISGKLCQLLHAPLAARVVVYCLVSSLLYLPVYQVMYLLFETQLVSVGIYLPLLVVDPLIIKRYERTRQKERIRTAVRKGLRTTIGYGVVLLGVGCLREWLALGTVFGNAITQRILLPLAGLPAGGFLLIGILCALWRSAIAAYKKHVNMEAKRGV